ncbi:MAG: RNA-binding protein [Balneolaceae bacterium]|nr:MAG: RNA-binding protein [Balneolaceae bacterium]
MKLKKYILYLLLVLSAGYLLGCSKAEDTPFLMLAPSETGIHFSNDLVSTPEFNIRNYLYFYDGGGVAAGDLNNNGLPDLFFVGNMTDNRLYQNLGDFRFEDVTESAGIINDPESWSTGVTMADVNGSGYLDIYVSRVNYLNKRGRNQLFINNGDMTFTEMAADYGIDFEGYSTQAAFFDYNKNGRLDLFLLNHSFHSEFTYGEASLLRERVDLKAGDRLFRNDGDFFTDVTAEAGIYSSALGYGLGLAITDINQNGYPDIYIGNDFHEDDYFYINNGDGTFTERLYEMVGHTSNSSMGNDVGDLNNSGRMDIVSLDMMPFDHEVYMRSGGPDVPLLYNTKRSFGFGEKNNRNTLQINLGNSEDGTPLFSEMAFASGIPKTDWSWAALLADFSNNGFKDIFITNGMPHRPNDLDYVSALNRLRQQHQGDELSRREYELIRDLPDVLVANHMYRNDGTLQFRNVASEWGLSLPSFSSGAVYADLNNNGRLDLVVSNINEPAFIYKNNFPEELLGNYLTIQLKGDNENSTGIGTKVFLYHGDELKYREQMPVRGFQSAVEHRLHFGLGATDLIDSLLVIWPDDRYEVLRDLEVNQQITLLQSDAEELFDYDRLHSREIPALLADLSDMVNFPHRHRENTFDDFSREPLMPYKLSTKGPALAVADVNGNGLYDLYMGGARDFPGKLFLQQEDGTFLESEQPDFFYDRRSEDVDALFFDATGNGLPDLYVVSGGNEYTGEATELLDRLYINTGEGQFRKSMNSIPEFAVNGSVVRAADFNGNGYLDLFVGGHSIPWRYGIGPRSFILENNGLGVFEDVTEGVAPQIETLGNVTSAQWVFQPGKELPDLVVAGEWMPVRYFENMGGKFNSVETDRGFPKLNGLWQSVTVSDLTGNGYPDIILGNFGINSRLKATRESPMHLYINDFDQNGQTAPVLSYFVNGIEKPFDQLDELMAQVTNLRQKVRSYADFASRNLNQIFEPSLLSSSLKKEINELRSLVLINTGDGSFEISYLPFEAQLFPVMDILAMDVTGSGNNDLLLTGNLFDVRPGIGGRQDAGYGLLLKNDGAGNFTAKSFSESGFLVRGESRSIHSYQRSTGDHGIVVARNNDTPLFFELRN